MVSWGKRTAHFCPCAVQQSPGLWAGLCPAQHGSRGGVGGEGLGQRCHRRDGGRSLSSSIEPELSEPVKPIAMDEDLGASYCLYTNPSCSPPPPPPGTVQWKSALYFRFSLEWHLTSSFLPTFLPPPWCRSYVSPTPAALLGLGP